MTSFARDGPENIRRHGDGDWERIWKMKKLPLVNIKMGTKSLMRFSNGNTLPLVQRPFGMAAFAPQTNSQSNWFFYSEHPYLEGIRLTHQPSPWIGDFAPFLLMPQNDIISNNSGGAWSSFRPGDAVMRPDYLKIDILRSNCRFELTPTERGASIRLTFGDKRASVLSFLPVSGNYTYEFDTETSTLIGTNDFVQLGIAENFKAYMAVRFSADSVDMASTRIVGEGTTAACHVPLKSRALEAKIGISYISADMAIAALERECGNKSFDELKGKCEDIWEEHLSRIEVTSDSEARLRTFYSCLYRTFTFPQKAYELDAEGNPIHYSPYCPEIRRGVRYACNGFWDTARTNYSLYTLIARDEFAEMLDGFVSDYEESGWLPRWIVIGECGCMPSTLIDAVIACAAVNGIGKRETLEKALEGMLHHANHASERNCFGRESVGEYLKYGYVPRDTARESVNLTLDAAYCDWCIATVAKTLGRDDLVEPYMLRSKNYRNIFDSATGFMRGRGRDGSMAEPFDPCSWGGEYTEGSAWQTSFYVPHDVAGLAALHGGRENLIKKLDELFETPPRYRVFGYGTEIHEMSEMAAVDFGQCAISNQPSFHVPFLYAALGVPEKTDYWVTKLVLEAFTPEADGFPGDEDNGSMSAWYVLACIGMYPLNPGEREMIACKPQVSSVKVLGSPLYSL